MACARPTLRRGAGVHAARWCEWLVCGRFVREWAGVVPAGRVCWRGARSKACAFQGSKRKQTDAPPAGSAYARDCALCRAHARGLALCSPMHRDQGRFAALRARGARGSLP